MNALGLITMVPGEPDAAPAAGDLAGRVPGTGHALPAGPAVLLASRIEEAFLAEAGWDPGTWVLRIDPGHPLLGRSICRAPGCQTTCAAKTGLCLDCRRRLAEAGLGLEDYESLPAPRGARWLGLGDGTCTVPGCPRPWVAAARPLCPEHHDEQQRLGAGTADFIGRPDVKPLISHGACVVVSCPRQLPAAGSRYCDAHLQRLRAACGAPVRNPTRPPGGGPNRRCRDRGRSASLA